MSEYQIPTSLDFYIYQYSRCVSESAKILCPKMFGGKLSTTKIDTHGRAWSVPHIYAWEQAVSLKVSAAMCLLQWCTWGQGPPCGPGPWRSAIEREDGHRLVHTACGVRGCRAAWGQAAMCANSKSPCGTRRVWHGKIVFTDNESTPTIRPDALSRLCGAQRPVSVVPPRHMYASTRRRGDGPAAKGVE